MGRHYTLLPAVADFHVLNVIRCYSSRFFLRRYIPPFHSSSFKESVCYEETLPVSYHFLASSSR